MSASLLHHIALLQVPLIGPVQARILLNYLPVDAIFTAKRTQIEKIPGIGEIRAQHIKQFTNFKRAEEEIRFLEKYKITALLYTDARYPQRLLKIQDAPTVLYYKGHADLNHNRHIAIIGSRSNSSYGKEMTEELVKYFATKNIHIISGMAAGIDAIAHKTSIGHQLPTIGVLAHGLDTIYPAQHKSLAKEILQQQGGLLTEFTSNTQPERYNFPRRNRIVAAISDAVIIVETRENGGSMITAKLALQYKKPLFALPGKTTDIKSRGCNTLIQKGSAGLLLHPDDILQSLGWESPHKKTASKSKASQQTLLLSFTPEEKLIVDLLTDQPPIHIDELKERCGLTSSAVAAAILSLELQNLLLALPGKMYKLA